MPSATRVARGSNCDRTTARAGGCAASGSPPPRRRLAEYLLRAPFALEKITDNAEAGSVLDRSESHGRTQRNCEVFSAPQFIAARRDQMPPKGGPQVRHGGWYSHKSRGARQRTAGAAAG